MQAPGSGTGRPAPNGSRPWTRRRSASGSPCCSRRCRCRGSAGAMPPPRCASPPARRRRLPDGSTAARSSSWRRARRPPSNRPRSRSRRSRRPSTARRSHRRAARRSSAVRPTFPPGAPSSSPATAGSASGRWSRCGPNSRAAPSSSRDGAWRPAVPSRCTAGSPSASSRAGTPPRSPATAPGAVAPLAPVLRAWSRPPRAAVAFRRDVDRGFGAGGARVSWQAAPGGGAPDGVAIATGRPLADIARLAAGLPDLEITRISRRPDGGWRLSARRAAPEAMPRSRFDMLARRPADGPTPDPR